MTTQSPLDRLEWLRLLVPLVQGNGPALAVAIVLAKMAGPTHPWPGIALLMSSTGYKRNAVIDGVKRLETAGALTVKRRDGTSNIYVLTHPDQLASGNQLPRANRLPRTKATSWPAATDPVGTPQPKQGGDSNKGRKSSR